MEETKKTIKSILSSIPIDTKTKLFSKKALNFIKDGFEKWKTTSVNDHDKKNWKVTPKTTLGSDIPRNLIYTPLDTPDFDYDTVLGNPGQPPFTRGVHPNMYRGKKFTMRQINGFGGPEDTNKRLKFMMDNGATGEKIDQINRVIQNVKKMDPGIKIDGELQFDAAVVPEVAKTKGAESEVAGHANELIFPNLDATNICIKAVHRLARSFYYGSIIQGSPMPFNDLSRGCAPVEVLSMSAITLMQVKGSENN